MLVVLDSASALAGEIHLAFCMTMLSWHKHDTLDLVDKSDSLAICIYTTYIHAF